MIPLSLPLNWLDEQSVQTLGWTLIHSLWQAAGLALLFWIGLAFTRNPRVRYAFGIVVLAAMLAAPVVTFLYLREQPSAPVPAGNWKEVISDLRVVATSGAGVTLPPATRSLLSVNWLEYSVALWLLGVGVFSLRALGGFLLIRKLVREQREPLSAELRERCAELQRMLRLNRSVQYFKSRILETPAVVGWIRPRVLLPVSALTGLSPQQLEAVIVHELAHIKRLDCFVNLFQIAAETLLFYHPAMWWVSRTIRAERENCCDDVAVAVSGNPGEYVRALTLMETWRSAPALLLAANTGSLRSRAGRLLGLDVMVRSLPQSGALLATFLCLAGVLVAGTALDHALNDHAASGFSTASTEPGSLAAPAPPAAPKPNLADFAPAPGRPAPARPQIARLQAVPPTPAAPVLAAAAPQPPDAPSGKIADESSADAEKDFDFDFDHQDSSSPKVPASADAASSYIAGLHAAGLKDLTVDQLIAMKIQGITPEYVREIKAAGLNPSISELIALKVQGVSPEYIHKLRNGPWKNATLGEIIALQVQGINPDQANELQRELGVSELSLGKLIALKVQGINAEYIRGMRAAGFKDLNPDQLLAAKVQGVTPEFVRQVRDHGFKDLTLHQLIGLKMAGIF